MDCLDYAGVFAHSPQITYTLHGPPIEDLCIIPLVAGIDSFVYYVLGLELGVEFMAFWSVDSDHYTTVTHFTYVSSYLMFQRDKFKPSNLITT